MIPRSNKDKLILTEIKIMKFLVLFSCAENSLKHQEWMKLGPETQQDLLFKGAASQEEWTKKYASKVKAESGSLGNTTIGIDSNGIHEIPSKYGKFIIVEANSREEAATMFLDHPHFKFFPGDGVEILEISEA